jgi:hypothetical protein
MWVREWGRVRQGLRYDKSGRGRRLDDTVSEPNHASNRLWFSTVVPALALMGVAAPMSTSPPWRFFLAPPPPCCRKRCMTKRPTALRSTAPTTEPTVATIVDVRYELDDDALDVAHSLRRLALTVPQHSSRRQLHSHWPLLLPTDDVGDGDDDGVDGAADASGDSFAVAAADGVTSGVADSMEADGVARGDDDADAAAGDVDAEGTTGELGDAVV